MARQRQRQKPQGYREGISRRRFIQGVVAASAATGAAALSAGATTSVVSPVAVGPSAVDAFPKFTQEQRDVLTAILNRIIPAEGAMPGAGDVGVGRFIEEVLREAPLLRRPVLGLVSALQIQGSSTPLTATEIDGRLQRMEQDQEASFNILLQATYTGYYSHPQVLAALGWGHPEAASSETAFFDSTILEEVRRRGPIYRHV